MKVYITKEQTIHLQRFNEGMNYLVINDNKGTKAQYYSAAPRLCMCVCLSECVCVCVFGCVWV